MDIRTSGTILSRSERVNMKIKMRLSGRGPLRPLTSDNRRAILVALIAPGRQFTSTHADRVLYSQTLLSKSKRRKRELVNSAHGYMKGVGACTLLQEPVDG